MSKLNYSEEPEVLQEALIFLLTEMDSSDSFTGIFHDGRIDGKFYSKSAFGLRNTFSYLAIQGSYDIDQGKLLFSFSRTLILKIAFALILAFTAIGSGKLFIETRMILISLIPIAFGLIGLLTINYSYRSNRSEFLLKLNNSLKLAKDNISTNEL